MISQKRDHVNYANCGLSLSPAPLLADTGSQIENSLPPLGLGDRKDLSHHLLKLREIIAIGERLNTKTLR